MNFIHTPLINKKFMKSISLLKRAVCFFLSSLILTAIFYGCNNSDYLEKFTREDFINKSVLEHEVIKIVSSKPINPRKLIVVRDSILLIQNKKPTDYCIQLYNIKSQKIIGSIAPKGKGPNEFLKVDVLYKHNDNYFLVRDKAMWRISRYNIDSVLQLGSDYVPIHYRGSNYAKEITDFDEHNFIYFNNRFIPEKEFSNENIKMLYKKKKIDYKQEDNEEFVWKNYPSNVTGGYIYTSEFKDSIFVSHLHRDRIDICNKNLDIVKTLIGPDNYKPKYVRARSKWELILHADNRYWRAYREGFYTEDAIYLLYDGANGVYYDNLELNSSEVFKISWTGELLHHYILDCFVSIITIDSEKKYIYGCKQESKKGKLELVQFELL